MIVANRKNTVVENKRSVAIDRIRPKKLMGAIVIACCLPIFSHSFCFDQTETVYSGTDPRLFDEGQHHLIHKSDKKIVLPGKAWAWYNSWHVVRTQPGIFRTSSGRGSYTLTNSFNYQNFETYTWAHLSFGTIWIPGWYINIHI